MPADHPLRAAQRSVHGVTLEFDRVYAKTGRLSIGPERLLRKCSTAIRSERLLMEQLDYNLLFRWFVGL